MVSKMIYKKDYFEKNLPIEKLHINDLDLKKISQLISSSGICIIEDVFEKSFVQKLANVMYETKDKIIQKIGNERLEYAGELGVLRTPMVFNDIFYQILENKVILSIVDEILSSNSILHLQNGFILPSFRDIDKTPKKFQNSYHMDFKRVLNGYLCSLNIMILVSDFSRENGGTLAVPGSHQMSIVPNLMDLQENTKFIDAKAGSILIFDSTLWHCAGINVSGKDRLGINHQFTKSYFKQQIDYVRTIGENKIKLLPERTKQILGWYTRVPTNIEEYYVPKENRLYRANQE